MQGPNTMNSCPRCAHDNSADVSVCGSCGLHLDGLCPVCGTQNDHSARFCGKCHHDFAAEAGERHQPSSGDLRDERHAASGPGWASSPPPGVDCPRCMHTNTPGALFCDNCGLIFADVQPLTKRPSRTVAGFALGNPAQRLAGFFVDGIIVFAIFALLAPLFLGVSVVEWLNDVEGGNQTPNATVLDAVISVTYGTLLVGAFATTIGKKLLGLSVVRIDGGRVSFKRALVRSAAKTALLGLIPWPGVLVGGLIFANILLVVVRPDHRSIHDLIAGTAVVRP